ncbi:tRNA (adenosine(37)-N6)-dimethylallyltransferase MiaA [candidate division WOR-3 bacterium]|nr:tRNA (adenosine(37)-N6)-dimethylallyltransferase MiaA [candidate division WOR-3 bacterium]
MKVLTIVGSTAAGKTQVAIEIAKRISGEIISADSRQIYKYLNIGTAKPTRKERKKTNIHLIDFIHPDNTYSCGQFARDAEVKIAEIIMKGNIPIVCGGTGLYIRALFNPLHKLPESDKDIKKNITHILIEYGIDYLYKKLLSIDPEWAKKINPRDKQRIVRGLEVYEITGKPLSAFIKKKKRKSKYLPYYIGLNLPREQLYQRINKRFDYMINNGLIEEVKLLLKKGVNPESSALRTIGYKEIIEYIQGKLTREMAIEKAKCRTRNFAKRQITWFNKIPGVQWYNSEDPDIVKNIISRWVNLHHI